MEYRLFQRGTVPHVSTFEFHEHRERAPHLEQPTHGDRLRMTSERVLAILYQNPNYTVSDLGCGDGGMLQLIRESAPESVDAWGYDFSPANADGWIERNVAGELLDVFQGESLNPKADLGNVVVVTEVLEHLESPHEILKRLFGHKSVQYIVCSSPYIETLRMHDPCHAWAWDLAGYNRLVSGAGFDVIQQDTIDRIFQVLVGWKVD